jgi:hypothetical protein
MALPANSMTLAAMGMNFAEVGFAFRINWTSLVVAMTLAVLMGCRGRLGHQQVFHGVAEQDTALERRWGRIRS